MEFNVTLLAAIVYIMIFLIGLSLGSFLNSWMWRRWENVAIIADRSMCRHCRRQLRWYENIPILSFIFLNGRCGTCRGPIGWNYPLVELFTAAAITSLALHYGFVSHLHQWALLRDIFFVTLLIIFFVHDLKYGEIPSEIVWLGATAGLIFNFFIFNHAFFNLLGSFLFGGGFFLVQYLISSGRWIGGGDVRMGAMMGIWLGWPIILAALFTSYVTGAAIGLFLLAFGKKHFQSKIPFGPYLAIGTFVAMMWGEEIIHWYLWHLDLF